MIFFLKNNSIYFLGQLAVVFPSFICSFTTCNRKTRTQMLGAICLRWGKSLNNF